MSHSVKDFRTYTVARDRDAKLFYQLGRLSTAWSFNSFWDFVSFSFHCFDIPSHGLFLVPHSPLTKNLYYLPFVLSI